MKTENNKMRDALLMVKKLFDGQIMFQPAIREAHEAVNAALAEPVRNCEVGSEQEQMVRFEKYCRKPGCDGDRKVNCVHPDTHCSECSIHWEQMPYEEEYAAMAKKERVTVNVPSNKTYKEEKEG